MGFTPASGTNSWMAGKQRCFTWINIGLPDTNLGQNERMTGMGQDDDTVYCDIQMPLAQGRELLELVIALRESNAYPCLDKVFECMQDELSTSIDIVENPPTWGPWGRRTN